MIKGATYAEIYIIFICTIYTAEGTGEYRKIMALKYGCAPSTITCLIRAYTLTEKLI